ncbi:hypothetical protein ACPOL_6201 [Acidisarcina polymorpha]|uniref:Uncharacterized protein n=1 Tax=Acidisarcina polymorpha TaxID=2211140 RepID=A0A2Z5GA43_9BACT|nr:hypothetical protein [Acidisarcina polymorpha]AXC15445.1 hypothetical protein ACPOL_6201 [Acidisarcina polymorpha]
MLHDLFFWLTVNAYLLVGLVAARKYRETHDRGFTWLLLAYFLPTILITIAQGFCEFVFWAHSPALPQIVASFESIRTIVQALGLALGMYMIGGRPRQRNLWRWFFDEPTNRSEIAT